MKKPIIYPYNRFSSSARELSQVLECRRIRYPERYVPYNSHVIINYGVCNPHPQFRSPPLVANPFAAVNLVNNKKDAFKIFSENGVLCPEYTEDLQEAKRWSENTIIVARSLLRASGGRGIGVSEKGEDPVEVVDNQRVQLWVKYVPKKAEFRVHVFNGEVIDVQQKRRRREEEVNSRIRNHSNGWIFAREDIVEPDGLRQVCLDAVKVAGLTFGAVDVIWNSKQNKCYVLEINTAPGLEGTTLQKYSEAIKKYSNSL